MSTPAISLECYFVTCLSRFGSYWDNLPTRRKAESEIVDYAKQKLLDGPTVLRSGNRTGSLTCLSIRFALEFNMDGTARDVTYELVEWHTRLSIGLTTGFKDMKGYRQEMASLRRVPIITFTEIQISLQNSNSWEKGLETRGHPGVSS